MKKYLPSVIVLVGTLAAVLLTLTAGASAYVGGLVVFFVAGAGASTALLLFLIAVVGRGERSIWPSLVLGGTVVPIVVVGVGSLLFYPLLLLAEMVVEWLGASGLNVGRSIEP